MKTRLYELDSLRGIAALTVVLYHYTTRYNEYYGHSIEPLFYFPFGEYGVFLIFIISGFVITLTLNSTKHCTDFLVSRLSRLFPAYWMAIMLTALTVWLFTLPGRQVGLMATLVNFTMLQDWLGVSRVDNAYWTLTIQLSFYGIMFLIHACNQMKNLLRIGLLWNSVIILAAFAEQYLSVSIHWAIKLFLILDYGNLFVAGIMFYKLTKDFRGAYLYPIILSVFADYVLRGGMHCILISLLYLAFFLLAIGRLSWLGVKPLVFVGSISYSLYLIHQNIGFVIIRSLYQRGFATRWSTILVPLTISVAVASVMYFFLEKPAIAAVRTKWAASKVYDHLARSGQRDLSAISAQTINRQHHLDRPRADHL
jgi:peptidoglycan/LPS O-acetylase OafA/YrhL